VTWLIVAVVLGGIGGLAYVTDGSGGTLNTTLTKQVRAYPPPGDGEARHPLGKPPAVATRSEGTGFRFLAHQPNSRNPVTWSPCRPIHYVTRPDHTPVGGAAVVTEAIAAVSTATGLRFVHDGSTDEAPAEDRSTYQKRRYGDHWAPVLITWATADEVPDFGIDVLAEARAAQMTTPSGEQAFVSGSVVIDATKMPAYLALDGAAAAQAVIMHELGHLVGLAHVNDKREQMYPAADPTRTELGSGDRAGLAALGRGECRTGV
jgi:hypothetical protein